MFKVAINIKSGIGGHDDYDNCDLNIDTVYLDTIPRKDELFLLQKRGNTHKFLITDVVYSYGWEAKKTWYTLYVVPVDGKNYKDIRDYYGKRN